MKAAELREAIASVRASLDCAPVEDPELSTVLAAAEAWAKLEWLSELRGRIPEDWRDHFDERVRELADDPHYSEKP